MSLGVELGATVAAAVMVAAVASTSAAAVVVRAPNETLNKTFQRPS